MCRVISFSPEKHKLLSEVNNSDNGVEIKKLKKNDQDDYIINQWSTVKRTKLSFPKTKEQMPISTIEKIINELPMFSRVSLIALLHNIQPIELDCLTNKQYRKAVMTDESGTIPITVEQICFENIENNQTYRADYMMISQTNNRRILKTTNRTIFKKVPVVIKKPKEDEFDSDTSNIVGKIIKVNKSTFNATYSCPYCHASIPDTSETVIECDCGSALLADAVSKSILIAFQVLKESKEKVDLFIPKEKLIKVIKKETDKDIFNAMIGSDQPLLLPLEQIIMSQKLFPQRTNKNINIISLKKNTFIL